MRSDAWPGHLIRLLPCVAGADAIRRRQRRARQRRAAPALRVRWHVGSAGTRPPLRCGSLIWRQIPHLQDARGGPGDRRSGWTDALFRDGRSDRLQGTLTETLGIALADLRQHDDALGQRRPNGVVAAPEWSRARPAPSQRQYPSDGSFRRQSCDRRGTFGWAWKPKSGP